MPNRLSTYTVHWNEHSYAVRFGLIQLAVEAYRKRTGATYEEIARRAEIDRTSLWRACKGRPVSPRTIRRILALVELTESEVLAAQGGAPALGKPSRWRWALSRLAWRRAGRG